MPYILVKCHTHTTVLWPFFWVYPGERVPEEEIFFWTLWCKEDNKGRHTDHTAGCHSIRTKSATHLHHPPIFTLDALPAATLPIYLGLGQAPIMLACEPSVLVLGEMSFV